jgi:hypothetical protein
LAAIARHQTDDGDKFFLRCGGVHRHCIISVAFRLVSESA